MDRIWLLLAAGMMCRPASFAQGQPAVMRLQRAGSLAADPGGREIAVGMRATLMRFQQAGSLAAGPGNEIRFRMPAPVTGLPFSATVTTHTTQSKPDGTYVSRTMTMVQYRDSDGRTRTEMGESTGASPEPVKLVTIRDPVAGVSYTIDPAKSYVVTGEIVDGTSTWENTTGVPVITNGNAISDVQVVVIPGAPSPTPVPPIIC
jgi:hypothetical protein